LSYQGKTQASFSYILPLNQESEGASPMITDFKEACRIINEDINGILKGRDVLGIKKIDDALIAYQKKKAEQEVIINDHILRACSEALLYAYS
jgi:hypothetical protein